MRAAEERKRYVRTVCLMAALYFLFGFVTWANGTLIPFLKLVCDLRSESLQLLVTFAFYLAYFCFALPSTLVLRAGGFRKGMALGLAVLGVGALIFIPAAMLRTYAVFLVGLFVQGAGL